MRAGKRYPSYDKHHLELRAKHDGNGDKNPSGVAVTEQKTAKTIHVVVIEDRHTDAALELFFHQEGAMKRAEEATSEMVDNYRSSAEHLDTELNDAMQREGWLYYASLEDAGSVRVEKHEPKDLQ